MPLAMRSSPLRVPDHGPIRTVGGPRTGGCPIWVEWAPFSYSSARDRPRCGTVSAHAALHRAACGIGCDWQDVARTRPPRRSRERQTSRPHRRFAPGRSVCAERPAPTPCPERTSRLPAPFKGRRPPVGDAPRAAPSPPIARRGDGSHSGATHAEGTQPVRAPLDGRRPGALPRERPNHPPRTRRPGRVCPAQADKPSPPAIRRTPSGHHGQFHCGVQ
jgi:hypothetical protein